MFWSQIAAAVVSVGALAVSIACPPLALEAGHIAYLAWEISLVVQF